jgi:3-hydroxybutyryl-CoA dehydratase
MQIREMIFASEFPTPLRLHKEGVRMSPYLYDEIFIGQKASISKTISEYDVYCFAGLSGDMNPAHIDEVYAGKTFFKTRIAHGMLLGGLISAVLGMKLPGTGTIFISNQMNFLAPVLFGDTVTATCEVIEKLEKGRIKMKTEVTNQNAVVVANGESVVSTPRVKVQT